MKKLWIVLILFLPIFGFSQITDGFYRADFTQNGDALRIEADFEVRGEILVGKLKIGTQLQNIRGTIESQILSATTERENGTSYQIFVNLRKSATKAELWKKTEQYTSNEREVSQTMTSGILRKIDPPAGVASEISDPHKLTIEYPKQTFPKEFSGTANVFVTKEGESTIYKVALTGLYANWDKRTLSFAVKQSADNSQKIWQRAGIDKLDYAEKITMTKDAFVTDKTYVVEDGSAGEIRILEENDGEVIFKLTNLSVKNSLNNEIASINGTIRAVKPKSK